MKESSANTHVTISAVQSNMHFIEQVTVTHTKQYNEHVTKHREP